MSGYYRISIDPNVRVSGNITFSGFEDMRDPDGHPTGLWPVTGQYLVAFEEEAGLQGPAKVVHVEHDKRLVYLKVPWAKFGRDTLVDFSVFD